MNDPVVELRGITKLILYENILAFAKSEQFLTPQ